MYFCLQNFSIITDVEPMFCLQVTLTIVILAVKRLLQQERIIASKLLVRFLKFLLPK